MGPRRPTDRDRGVAVLSAVTVLSAVAEATLLVAATTAAGTPTATDATAVGVEGTISGFTLTAGLLAVLAGGVYWYYNR